MSWNSLRYANCDDDFSHIDTCNTATEHWGLLLSPYHFLNSLQMIMTCIFYQRVLDFSWWLRYWASKRENMVGNVSFLLSLIHSDCVIDQYYYEHRFVESMFHFKKYSLIFYETMSKLWMYLILGAHSSGFPCLNHAKTGLPECGRTG